MQLPMRRTPEARPAEAPDRSKCWPEEKASYSVSAGSFAETEAHHRKSLMEGGRVQREILR